MANRFLRKGLNPASPLLQRGLGINGSGPSMFRSRPAYSQEPSPTTQLTRTERQTESQSGFVKAHKYDRSTHKRCIKCHCVKPLDQFGFHGDSHTKDNKQTVCLVCKNIRAKERMNADPRKRLRHHIATRVNTQLGVHAPPNITAELDDYLGYSMSALVKHLSRVLAEEYPGKKLRDVLNDGWHVDHLYPLSRFPVIVEPSSSDLAEGLDVSPSVDWEEFRRCWALSNLKAIPAADNLAKGAKISEEIF